MRSQSSPETCVSINSIAFSSNLTPVLIQTRRVSSALHAFVMILVVAIALSIAACEGNNEGGTTPNHPHHTATPTATPTAVASAPLWVVDNANNRTIGYTPPIDSNGPLASVVLGQTSFTTSNCQSGTTPTAYCQSNPFAGAAVDSNGNVWVTDLGNNRVLRYPSPFSNGENADLVIGQSDFVSAGSGSGAAQLYQPIYVELDRHGNLWVSDTNNNRVLEYVPPFTNGMAATLVIGQPGFSSTTCVNSPGAATASGMCSPWGIAFDSNDDLFVSDNGNSRILEYEPPFSNGMSASFVIGQPNFTSNSAPTTPAANLVGAFGIAIDASDNVWAADVNYGRVIEFPPPTSNGENAIRVLGEPNFTTYDAQCPSSSPPNNQPTDSLICEAFDVKVDSAGNVYAADNDNNRMLVWDAPITANGQAANFVVGQTSFTSTTAATTQAGLFNPSGIALPFAMRP